MTFCRHYRYGYHFVTCTMTSMADECYKWSQPDLVCNEFLVTGPRLMEGGPGLLHSFRIWAYFLLDRQPASNYVMMLEVSGNLRGAINLFKEMQAADIKPSIQTYSTLIRFVNSQNIFPAPQELYYDQCIHVSLPIYPGPCTGNISIIF